jgi:hypothetical protein
MRRCTETAAIATIEPIVDALQRKENNGKLESEGSKQERVEKHPLKKSLWKNN